MEGFIMYDKKYENLRLVLEGILILLMLVTVVLQVLAFEALCHCILSACVLLLIVISLVFDLICKDTRKAFTHVVWCAMWIFILIMGLTKF